MAHPMNLAMPASAVVGLVSQVKVAPSGVVRVRVSGLVSVVTVFPAASWMVTTGWRAHPVSLIAVGLGAVVNASLAAVRTVRLLIGVRWTVPEAALTAAGSFMGVLFLSVTPWTVPTTVWMVPTLEPSKRCCHARTVARYAVEWL